MQEESQDEDNNNAAGPESPVTHNTDNADNLEFIFIPPPELIVLQHTSSQDGIHFLTLSADMIDMAEQQGMDTQQMRHDLENALPIVHRILWLVGKDWGEKGGCGGKRKLGPP